MKKFFYLALSNITKMVRPIFNNFSGVSLFTWRISDNIVKFRLIIVIACFFVGFIALQIRLMLVASDELDTSPNSERQKMEHRLDILDRNGNLLAVNLPTSSLYANPHKIVDTELCVQKLKNIFPEIDEKKLLSELTSDKNFVWVKRDLTPKEKERVFNLGLPGFEFENESKRIYPHGNLLSHVIGYVGRDMTGLAGIEKYHDEQILINPEITKKKALVLSIDVRLQNILSEEIEATMTKFHAKGAAGIIVDPNNGEVLAMVSKPDFDPHYPGKANQVSLFNMATQGVYEMGSGFKIFPIAIGLDIGSVKMNDAYDLTSLKIGKFSVKDYHPSKGWSSVSEIFIKSSNIGAAQIILEVGKENFRNYLKKLRILDKLELEIPECARPLFPQFSSWSELSLVTMSYGYAISQSPAHIAQAIIPIANGGILYPLTLIKREKIDQDKKNKDTKIDLTSERVFRESTSRNMLKMMRLLVKEGTGKKAEVSGYYVGGKTGTADKLINGKYDKRDKWGAKRMSSFIAVFPATDPRFIIYITYDEPQGIKESYGFAGGGWTAAETVGNVVRKITTLYGMENLDPYSEEVLELNDIEYKITNET